MRSITSASRRGQPHAAPLEPDQDDAVDAAVALDDLVGDPGGGPLHVAAIVTWRTRIHSAVRASRDPLHGKALSPLAIGRGYVCASGRVTGWAP